MTNNKLFVWGQSCKAGGKWETNNQFVVALQEICELVCTPTGFGVYSVQVAVKKWFHPQEGAASGKATMHRLQGGIHTWP